MSATMITQAGLIRVGHPIREEFSGCSSGPKYYETKGHAVRAFEAVLNEYNLCFDPNDCMDMPGVCGCAVVEVYSKDLEGADYVANVVMSWHLMDRSGRWEFIGYIA